MSQERILASRIIHYNQEQLFWECLHLDACETYPDCFPRPTSILRLKSFDLDTEVSSDKKRALGSRRNVVAACSGRNLTRAEEDKLEVSSNKKYALRYWHKIVDAYSGCKLTRAKDKLVAISGLAKRVQSFSGDEYLAGLWKKALLYGLLWRAQWEDLIEEHASSQAPTWSWASIEGFIFYDDLMIPWDDEEHLSIKIVTILASGVISVALMSLDKSKSVSPA